MTVKNYPGSSRWKAPKGYSSWLAYWEDHKGKAKECQAFDCSTKTNLVGAHVQKVNSADKGVYIVPLCSGCNQRTDEFDVSAWKLLPVPSRLDE